MIAAGTVLFFILAFFPWFTFGDEFFGFTLSGFDSGNVTSAFVLFLLTTAWAVLPAFVDLRLGFPRSWITVGLATLAVFAGAGGLGSEIVAGSHITFKTGVVAAGGLALALGGFLALALALAGMFLTAALIHFPAVVRRPAPIPQEAAA